MIIEKMITKPVIFAFVFLAAMLVFLWSCFRRFGLISIGRPENRFNRPGIRLRDTFIYAFAQKRVLQKPFGLNHFILFWSFMVLLLANAEFVLRGLFPAVSFRMLPAVISNPLYFIFDLFSLLAFACVIIAGIRRAIAPPYPGSMTFDAYIILSLIAGLMIAYFNLHGLEIAVGEEKALMPVSHAVCSMFYFNISPEKAHRLIEFWWWLHALIFLFFLNYLPYSKHMHILSSIPNCYLRRFEKANTLPLETFVKGGRFGAETLEDFTWKDLFDSYSCTECGRCQMACPASVTGKPLNPRQVIHDLKVNLLVNGPPIKAGGKPQLPLIGDAGEGCISEDQIWSCTSCGACMEVCPVFIEQMPKILLLRRNLVEMKSQFPEELLNLFENMEQRSNPWGIAPTERTKWCSQVDVKTFESSMEYLFYVGCAGAFDSRSKQVSIAMASILDAAGVSYGILGRDEACCGDSLRRLGNEYVFDVMAKRNVKLFSEKGVKKIITMCPHCYSTLNNDYRQYGMDAEVVHHSDFINELIAAGRLKLKTPVDMGRVIFHDSCYLGRHNNIYDPPRRVIGSVTGRKPVEMERNHEKSFCCGAGGGRMWMEEHLGTRINLNRVAEALSYHPDTLCVTCPYCMTMFDDGIKDMKAEKVAVMDIAEIVAKALN